MRFNKTFCLKICPISTNNITQLPTHYSIYGSYAHYVTFICQPMKIKKPYSSPPTHNTCCHLPTHLCFYGNFHLRNTSFQVVNQSESSNHSHHLPHLTRVVDIHLHIFTYMDIFTHALRHFKSSSNQRTRWY